MAENYLLYNFPKYDLADKPRNINDYIRYMLCRTSHIFKYEGLPETIPERELELQLQCYGHVGFVEVNGSLYALQGNYAGIPDAYYMPTQYIIANPFLKLSKTYDIHDNVVVMPNDTIRLGLLPLISRTSTQLAENDLSMLIADINSRMITLISATDDNTVKGAQKYIEDIINGHLSAVGDDAFFEGLKANPVSGATASEALTNLIEYQQYLKASLYNDIGLDANYNMKREAINSTEAQMNNDGLYPLIDDMLICRQRALDEVNAKFGTSISVDFDGVWKRNRDVEEMEVAAMEKALESSEEEPTAAEEPDTKEEEVKEASADETE